MKLQASMPVISLTPVIIAAESIADFDGDSVEQVTLDATESQDPDGSIVSYEWRIDDQLPVQERSLRLNSALGSTW